MKKKILFVDDEPNFLNGIRRMLRGDRHEWDLSFVNSVDEALQTILDEDFDAIVSDVNMPLKTGFDLLAALGVQEKTSTIPVIILTGNAEADLKRRALEMGATDLLNKPVFAEDLRARIRSVLRLKSFQDQLKASNEHLEEKVRERTWELDCANRDIIWRLAKAGEFRDEETGDHVVRVACGSRILAETLGLDGSQVETIFLTSPLHDIGKIGIPDDILLKRGSLTAQERKTMESHCQIGASVLLEEPKGKGAFLKASGLTESRTVKMALDPLRTTAAEIAMTHHEYWDGSGYPNGLKGEDIPITGRIVAMADVYDALRSARPYKEEFDLEMTMKIIMEGVGTHFDPDVFEAFEGRIEDLEAMRAEYML
jgi:response regulator RpfG family c-di-GMP phosphodiesterase